jgi:signal transduction histidine kinase
MFEYAKFLFRKPGVAYTVAACWLIGINLVWLIPTMQTIRISSSTLALEIADRVRSSITFSLEDDLQSLGETADALSLEPDRREVILQQTLKHNPSFENIALIGRDGKEKIRVDRFRLVTAKDLQDHSKQADFYLTLAGVPNFGSVFLSPNFEPHSILSAPAQSANGDTMVIAAEVNLKSFVSAVQTFDPARGVIYVVDRSGSQIIHPDISEVLKNKDFSSRTIVQKILIDGVAADGLASDDSYVNDDGVRVFVVGVPIPIVGWGLIVEQPSDQALRGLRSAIVLASAVFILGMMSVYAVVQNYARLRRLNERLKELDAAKSEFVSIAAHQLRTPLSITKWILSMLLKGDVGPLSPEQKDLILRGNESNERMIDLINSLLSVSRIESGRLEHEPLMLRIESLIESVLHEFSVKEGQTGIKVVFEKPPVALPAVNADPQTMCLVIQNLIDNAVKYTMKGGTVTVKATRDDGNIMVSVADTGIGIPTTERDRIFSKFFRASNAKKVDTTGSGLGLFVVKSIVEKHGGDIWFTSKAGEGTVFYFTLPIPLVSHGK